MPGNADEFTLYCISYHTVQHLSRVVFQVDSPGTVPIITLLDILALDILGLDILGLDILGLDILGMIRKVDILEPLFYSR